MTTAVMAVLALAVSGCGAVPGGAATAAGGYREAVTISRDEFGVPTIEGDDEAAATYGLAYAMAEDGIYAVEDAYASAIGIASSYYGAVAQADDELRLRLQVVPRARAAYAALPPEERHVVDAFAEGLNAWYHDHPQTAPRIIGRFDPWMVIAVLENDGFVADVERALQRGSKRLSLALGVSHTSSINGDPLLLIASRAKRPYEARVIVSNQPWFHGFYEMGAVLPHEGFSSRIAFAPTYDTIDLRLARVATSSLKSAVDSIRLNTAQGVIAQKVTTAQSERGPAAYVNGDTAFVVDEASIRYGAFQRLHASIRATDAAAIARSISATDRVWAIVSDAGGISVVRADSVLHVSALAVAPGRQIAADSLIRNDSTWTLQKLIRAAFDGRVHGAPTEISALIDEWEQVGARNPERALRLDSAIAALRAWDQVSSIGSSTITLYAFYRARLEGRGAEPFARFTALESVLADARRPIRPWGNANAIRRGERATPVAGAPTTAGTMFTYDATSHLEHYIWAVDLRTGVAGSVFSFGLGYTESAHWFDQAPLFAAGSLKTLGGAARASYHPGETPR